MISNFELNSQFGRKQSDYRYLMTMWIYMEEGTAVEPDYRKAKSKAIVFIEEVFFCFMASVHNFKCVIEGIKEYQNFETKAVEVPLNEWVNI